MFVLWGWDNQWLCYLLFLLHGKSRTIWSQSITGYMQSVWAGNHSLPAVVRWKALIDLNPDDRSCSTLAFVCEQAKQLNVVPSITFDLPVWIKAYSIDRHWHCHPFTSWLIFLGVVVKMMAGWTLKECLWQIYGTETITHVLNGNMYARSLGGHFLI